MKKQKKEAKKIEINLNQGDKGKIIFQVLTLIIGTFAFAYLIHQADKIGIFPEVLPSVSAQTESWNCCRENKVGAICQDISSAYCSDECNTDCIPTKCEEVADCNLGCCFDPVEGLCTTRATKQKCESDGGVWKNEENCLIEECQKGCCVLGDNSYFGTEQRCKTLSLIEGFEKDLRDVQMEIECFAIRETLEKGACVVRGSCSHKTENECLTIGGKFYKGDLCSNPGLETNCKKQANIGCVDGKDEIYWFDSCGNVENIYSSDKEAGWNNGKMLNKNESCNPVSSNADSETCGNCNYLLGSRCVQTNLGEKKVKDGNFICRDMNCPASEATGGKERKNGESWCVYDSYIGDGKDPAGSRHWKRICIDGEVKVEPCADYRGQICIQSEPDETGFTIASCVMNEAVRCIEGGTGGCEDNTDCMIKHIDVDKGFEFDVCVGKYPRGFDFTGKENANSGGLCSMANQKCTVIYEKKLSGWKCVMNCNCEEDEFAEQMNDLCISLGDCGSYINYIGDGTDNIMIENDGEISWGEYAHYANPVEGQYAQPKDSSEFLASMGVEMEKTEGKYGEAKYKPKSMSGAVGVVGAVSGALGAGMVWLSTSGSIFLFTQTVIPIYSTLIIESIVGSTIFAGIGSALSAFGIAMAVGSLIGMAFGLKGDAAMIMTIASAVVGVLYSAYVYVWGFDPTSFLIMLIILIIIAIILKLLGIGKTKKVIVKFECYPWQPPPGGANCERCNGDPLKPCSEYRCTSLGQACELINLDSENPLCVAKGANDGTPPVISPGIIDDGFMFENEKPDGVSVKTKNRECIPAFTPVVFSLETDENAQCKFDLEKKDDYDSMTAYFAETTFYTKNHTNMFLMPSLEVLEKEYEINITNQIKEKLANMDMYVRCKDIFENYNKKEYSVNFCVSQGPDRTAPLILKTIPKNNAVLKYDTKEISLKVYLNEPAECKFSKEDKSYKDMENTMNCNTELSDVESDRGKFGWPCSTTLTNLQNNENKFYIKCKDQPWLTAEKDSERNVNTESYELILKVSQSQLKIENVEPQGEISGGYEPFSIDLEVETSGGSENGKSACYYSFLDYTKADNLFLNTFSKTHKQNFNMMAKGNYNIYVKCVDDSGNLDYGNATFSLNLDTTPPIAVRIYNDAGRLKIITDEEAECYYAFNRCSFNIDNKNISISMTTAFSKEHSADWNSGLTYYIKCKDVWGNAPSEGCTIKVLPGFF